MKKFVSALAAAALLVSFTAPAHAAFNPTTINDSDSRENILNIINDKVEDGETSGVTGGYAWVYINGEVISLHTRVLQSQGSRDRAVAHFEEYVQNKIGSNIEFMLEDLAEAQTLFNKVVAAQPELNIEVVKAIVTAQFPDVVFIDRIVERTVNVEVVREVFVNVPVVETVTVIEYRDREIRVEVPVVTTVEVADPDAYNNGFAAGVASVTPEDGITQATVDAAVAAARTQSQTQSYNAGFSAGVASVDASHSITIHADANGSIYDISETHTVNADGTITININQQIEDANAAGHAAGVMSVDITSDNAGVIAAAISAAKARSLASIPTVTFGLVAGADIAASLADHIAGDGTATAASYLNSIGGQTRGTWTRDSAVVGGVTYSLNDLIAACNLVSCNPNVRDLFIPNGNVDVLGRIALVSPLGNTHTFTYAVDVNNATSVAHAAASIAGLAANVVAQSAFEAGYAEGAAAGYITGYGDGYGDGYRDGYSDGYTVGYRDGVNSVN